jgi:eukaryotic-like serine/threonine-protein kinase
MAPYRRCLLLIVLIVGCRSGTPSAPPPPGPQAVWVFEAPRPGSIVATPRVTVDHIYLAAAHTQGFNLAGAVYALDPATGKSRWVFDRDGHMLPTASAPLLIGDRLYFGEGMHGHFACRLHCVDAATGQARWHFATGDHVEGGPIEAGGLVLFPAGNDGLYAVDATSGEPKWNFRADVHIDSSPCVSGNRAFVGTGKSRRFSNYQVVCLDVPSGNPVWRTPVHLPAWGDPIVAGERIYVGLGNGRLNESAKPPETPAGGLTCVDATNGKLLWSFPTGDAVFGRPAIVGERVVVGSRDGNLYGLAVDGHEAWRLSMGGPVVAGVASVGAKVYAVSVAGRIVCVDAASGREEWRHELGRVGVEPHVFASPVVLGQRLYIAAEMTTGQTGIVSLFCFELPADSGGGG